MDRISPVSPVQGRWQDHSRLGRDGNYIGIDNPYLIDRLHLCSDALRRAHRRVTYIVLKSNAYMANIITTTYTDLRVY
jgi:hypothetical protein